MEDDKLRKIESFTFLVNGNKVEATVVNSGIWIVTDENDEDVYFTDWDGNEIVHDRVAFYLKF